MPLLIQTKNIRSLFLGAPPILIDRRKPSFSIRFLLSRQVQQLTTRCSTKSNRFPHHQVVLSPPLIPPEDCRGHRTCRRHFCRTGGKPSTITFAASYSGKNDKARPPLNGFSIYIKENDNGAGGMPFRPGRLVSDVKNGELQNRLALVAPEHSSRFFFGLSPIGAAPGPRIELTTTSAASQANFVAVDCLEDATVRAFRVLPISKYLQFRSPGQFDILLKTFPTHLRSKNKRTHKSLKRKNTCPSGR